MPIPSCHVQKAASNHILCPFCFRPSCPWQHPLSFNRGHRQHLLVCVCMARIYLGVVTMATSGSGVATPLRGRAGAESLHKHSGWFYSCAFCPSTLCSTAIHGSLRMRYVLPSPTLPYSPLPPLPCPLLCPICSLSLCFVFALGVCNRRASITPEQQRGGGRKPDRERRKESSEKEREGERPRREREGET